MDSALRRQGDFWSWSGNLDAVRVRFCGKRVDGQGAGSGHQGAGSGHQEQFRALVPEGVEPAWLQQIHSATVRDARPGLCGRGDALFTRRRGLALAVVTADCVPVLLAAGDQLAAVHAGWRGLANRILAPALERFEDPGAITGWIGPSIGPCCYEVSEEVAAKVATASSPEIVRPGSLQAGPQGRPPSRFDRSGSLSAPSTRRRRRPRGRNLHPL